MCLICNAFTPYLNGCAYDGLSPTTGTTTTTSGVAAIEPDAVVEEGGSDAANDASTASSFNVGEAFHGTIGAVGDVDWIEVQLVQGQEYTVAAAGIGGLTDSLRDPFLRVLDSGGNELFSHDNIDGGANYYFSDITFTAATTGTFYIEVGSSAADTFTGDYGVSIVTGDTASYSDEMGAGMLLSPNAAWTTTPGTGASVTWGIRDTVVPDPANNSNPDPNFNNDTSVAVSASQAAAISDAMGYFDALTGLNFTQVDDGGGVSDNATMLFGAYGFSDGRGAYAYYPDSWGDGNPNTSVAFNAGDVWLNNNGGMAGSYDFGGFAHFALLHEIGHAVGLAHPGPYNAGGGNPVVAEFMQDSHQYTVMSYFDETTTGVSAGLGYPDTLMLFDLLALHQLYGEDATYNAGNTIYGFNATSTGSAYDFSANTTPFLSIYDGQGDADTIDLSGYSMGQTLDLREGFFSDVGGYTSNLSVAYGAVIENAIGGTGNDSITGNDADNDIDGGDGGDTLIGGDGEDTLTGGAGADRLVGGAGADSLEGGDGDDTIDATDGADEVFIDATAGSTITATGNAAATLNINDPGATHVNSSQIMTSNGATINHSGFGSIQFLCFCAGTQIATPDGQTAVEHLTIGDLVRTQNGRAVPVKWIGHQTVMKAFAGEKASPVRIQAGAIATGIPSRDLLLTSDHALMLDGMLVNAAALVNGQTICFEPLHALPDRFVVYHVETEHHDLIMANGTLAETYLDMPGRAAFDNFSEYLALFGHEETMSEMALPRVSSARLLPLSLKAKLDARIPRTEVRCAG